jgi:hypothetical protein
MANIYTKTMREALQEARDYREPTDVSEGNLSYDEWLKQVKGIEKGAHGINSDEHAKYSKEWKAYANTSESKLTEIVGGRGEMTVTKDGGVMIIKTKDWQTYKAKGWNKKEEVEEGYSTATRSAIKRAYLAGPTKTGKDVAKALKKVGKGAELYIQTTNPKTGRISNSGVVLSVKGDDVTISPTARNLPNKVKAKDISHMDVHKARTEELEEDCGCGHGSDCGCPSDCDCGCNAVNTEKMNEGKDYRLLAQRDTMNLSKQATVDFVADLYKKLDKLGEL